MKSFRIDPPLKRRDWADLIGYLTLLVCIGALLSTRALLALGALIGAFVGTVLIFVLARDK